jgi:hypothetical protein
MNPQFVLFQMILSLECTSTKTDEFSYQQMNFDVMSQAILGLKGFQASWAWISSQCGMSLFMLHQIVSFLKELWTNWTFKARISIMMSSFMVLYNIISSESHLTHLTVVLFDGSMIEDVTS